MRVADLDTSVCFPLSDSPKGWIGAVSINLVRAFIHSDGVEKMVFVDVEL